DYFAFRTAFNAVKSAIGLSSWQFEHLLALRDKNVTKQTDAPVAPPAEIIIVEDVEDVTTQPDESTHTRIQWLLAKIGQKVGCQVWIAANDRSKSWKGQK